MTRPSVMRRKLSKDILAALLAARKLHEDEVADRLLEALEVMAQGDVDDEALRLAYTEIAAMTPSSKG